MRIGQDIRIAVAGNGGPRCGDLIQAMRAERWDVVVAGSLEDILPAVEEGKYHMVVVASETPKDLPRPVVRTLLSLQSDVSVLFLLPSLSDLGDCPAVMGAMSDQVYDLSAAPAELMAIMKSELLSVLSGQARYLIMCVDDDEEFLASLRAFLPRRLSEAFPPFALDFGFFASPVEALAAAKDAPSGRLAVVISDQVMVPMKGTELLGRIKALCPGVQCVLLTGHADLSSAVTALNEQVLDKYFFKPIEEPVDFASNVRHLLREFHLRSREEMQRHRLMAQFEYIRAISAATSTEKALAVTVEFLREQMSARRIMVLLAQGEELVVRAGVELPAETPVGSSQPADEGVAGWVFGHGRPVLATTRRDLPDGLTPEPFASLPLMAAPLIVGRTALGAFLIAGRKGSEQFARDERMLMSFVADTASMTIGGLEDRQAIEHHYVGTMASLMETVEAKDNYTRGHTDRVTELTVSLAEAVGMSGKALEDVRRAAELHDIGKIAVPDRIIAKPGRLDDEEYSIVRKHPAQGDRILQHLRFLDSARMIIRSHHERYDGKGYPDGLGAEEIPLGARILAIADSYDAMTSARPYRNAMAPSEALAEISRHAGTQFQPGLVAVFLKIMDRKCASAAVSTCTKERA